MPLEEGGDGSKDSRWPRSGTAGEGSQQAREGLAADVHGREDAGGVGSSARSGARRARALEWSAKLAPIAEETEASVAWAEQFSRWMASTQGDA